MKRRFNNCGTITKLKGNRAKPYWVRGPVEEIYNVDTKKVESKRPTIGYFKTGKEADAALSDYVKNPYDVDTRKLTFSDVYKMYYDAKYVNGKKKFSKASEGSTKSAYKNCRALHDMIFTDIKVYQLQKVIDDCPLKHSSLELIQSLFKQMYSFAISNDITDKDYGKYTTINIPDDDEQGVPFTWDELKILWKNKDKTYVDTILIMIYSGYRIAAFKNLQINLNEKYFKGGVKTKAGRDRIVPIHPSIFNMVESYDGDTWLKFGVDTYRTNFYTTLDSLGIGVSSKNTKHTPHDCRHTFSWLCDKYKVDDTSKHLLMGHVVKGDVEKKVYAHRTLEELRAEIEKISTPKM